MSYYRLARSRMGYAAALLVGLLWQVSVVPVPNAGEAVGKQLVKPKIADLSINDAMTYLSGVIARGEAGRDDVLEPWLSHVIAEVNKARQAKNDAAVVKLQLPRKRENVAFTPFLDGRELDSVFFAGNSVKLNRVTNSILWIDGDVNLSYCTGSIVVATGMVSIGHSRDNIVVSNHLVQVRFDGDPRGRMAGPRAAKAVAAGASLVISRDFANIAHANESVVVARRLDISHAYKCGLINVQSLKVSHDTACEQLMIPQIKFGEAPPHPLAERVTLKWIAEGEGIAVVIDQKRYALDVGQAVVDQDGKPVAEFAGWILRTVTGEQAVLANEKEGGLIILSRRSAQP